MLNNQGQALSILMAFIIKRGISWIITQTCVKLQQQQVLQEKKLRTYDGGWGRHWLSWNLKDEWDLLSPRKGRVILLPFLKVFKSSSFPATWNPASQASVQGVWPPGQPSSPATLPHTPVPQPCCTALHFGLCAFLHALPATWNANFWDWLLVKTSEKVGKFRFCSKSTLSLRLCCSPQPIHLSSSVSLSPATTSHQELVTLCIYLPCMHTPYLPKQLDGKILASFLQLTSPTVPFLE